MSDDPVLAAVQQFMDAVEERMSARESEIRGLLEELQTRATTQVIEGPPGPAGKDGAPGKDGVDGKDGPPGIGEKGERGADGKDGKSAVSIATTRIQDGNLIVRLTDGVEQIAGRVVGDKGDRGEPGIGERGADGKDGRDGADSTIPGPKGDPGERGTDGIATREELHSLIEERMADVQVRTFADVYQGVYEPSRTYTRGLLATWGGSLWLSQSDTKSKPGENADWRLIVKKGADGKK